MRLPFISRKKYEIAVAKARNAANKAARIIDTLNEENEELLETKSALLLENRELRENYIRLTRPMFDGKRWRVNGKFVRKPKDEYKQYF